MRFARWMPLASPAARTAITAIQTIARGISTPGTNSRLKPGSPTWRYSFSRKACVSSPQRRSNEKMKKLAAHAMTAV